MSGLAGAKKTIGRYRLHDPLASGGMAVVHLGRLLGPAGFSRTVAIKRLHAQVANDPEFVAMLLDEARLASRVRHPNVAPVFDVVVEDGEVCLVLEYVQGESLARLLGKARAAAEPVPVGIAVAIVLGMLYGLAAAHDAVGDDGAPLDIVHRDVSPQNVLVGADGIARVIDFGVAKATARLQTTHEGELKGKLGYMSPEQLKRVPVDKRTDVFAAGVVLWEALAGKRLFEVTDLGEVVQRAVKCDVDPPSKHSPFVSEELDEVVLKALTVDPNDRYQSAAEFAEALADVAVAASPQDVGEWVLHTGGEDYARRRARVLAIERGEGDYADAGAPDAEAPTASPQTVSLKTATYVTPTTRSPLARGAMGLGIAAVVATLAVGTVVRLGANGETPAPAAAAARVEAPARTAEAPPSPPAAETSPPAVAAAPAPSAPSKSARPVSHGAATKKPTAAKAATPTAEPAPAPPPAAAPPGKPAYCSQGKLAFTIGPDGVERPRPECL